VNTIATVLLLVLALILFQQWRAKTLGQWLRAKLFNDPGGQ
jgi:hypothetical protein